MDKIIKLDKVYTQAELLLGIMPPAFNYGQAKAGSKVNFKFKMDLPIEPLGFSKGCGCQGDVSLEKEGDHWVLKGTMEMPRADYIEKEIQAYEQNIDVHFDNPLYVSYKDEKTKELEVAQNATYVRLWITGNVEK
jgi:hypothetical protein